MTNDSPDNDDVRAILQGAVLEEETVWVYIDTRKHVVDKEYLKVFANEAAAAAWFAEHDLEGEASEYPVMS